MANRVQPHVWADPGFRTLSAPAQRGYLMLSMIPSSGALLISVDAWAEACPSETPQDVRHWLGELEIGGFADIYRDTQQVVLQPVGRPLIPVREQRRFTPHRALLLRMRVAVLVRDRFVCQICGARPAEPPSDYDGTWLPTVVLADGRVAELTLDHIKADVCGGTYTEDNLRAACQPCNSARGAVA